MGTRMRVLIKSFPMNTNMTDGLQRFLRSCALGKSILSIGRIKLLLFKQVFILRIRLFRVVNYQNTDGIKIADSKVFLEKFHCTSLFSLKFSLAKIHLLLSCIVYRLIRHSFADWNSGNPSNKLLQVSFNPFNVEVTTNCPKHKDAKIFENHVNPVKLVFIG